MFLYTLLHSSSMLHFSFAEPFHFLQTPDTFSSYTKAIPNRTASSPSTSPSGEFIYSFFHTPPSLWRSPLRAAPQLVEKVRRQSDFFDRLRQKRENRPDLSHVWPPAGGLIRFARRGGGTCFCGRNLTVPPPRKISLPAPSLVRILFLFFITILEKAGRMGKRKML